MKWKNYAILALTVLVIGLLVRGLSGNAPLPQAPKIEPVKDQRKSADDAERATAKVTDSLRAIVDREKKKTAAVTASLKQSQDRARELERTVTAILNTGPVTATDPQGNDYTGGTTEMPVNDSAAIMELVYNSRARDSLCNAAMASLEKQVEAQDSAIAERDRLYTSLRAKYDKGLGYQQELLDYGKDLKKQLKWARAGNRLWKGTAIAAGIYILKTIIIKK